jgi:carbon storage regulator CsrA
MLVLNRRREERAIITASNGERITVLVVDVRGDSARLGFDAPPGVTIHREEVQAQVDRGEGRRR